MRQFYTAFGIPFGYSISMVGVNCTDLQIQICVSELIILAIWSGYSVEPVVSLWYAKVMKGNDL